MYNKNLGDHIKDIVEDAVKNCDYSDLNRKIKNTVESAVEDCKRATNGFIHGNDPRDQWIRGNSFGGPQSNKDPKYRNPNGNRINGQNFGGKPFGGDPFRGTSFEQGTSSQAQNAYGRQQNFNRNRAYHQNQKRNQNQRYNQPYTSYNQNQKRNKNQRYNQPYTSYNYRTQPNAVVTYSKPVKGSVSSVLGTIFGGLNVFVFGVATISFLCECIANRFSVSDNIGAFIVGMVVTLLNVWWMSTSLRRKKYITRYKKYKFLLQKNRFCETKRLADMAKISEKQVIKDLEHMISELLFPEGRFDAQKKYFMLDEVTYKQYESAQQSYQERKKEEEKIKKEETERQEKREINPELAKAIEEGETYLKGIREANDDIPGEEISKKLDQLEDIIRKIFVCVEKHPEKLPEIRKLMEYYLPITMKLVNAYKEFDSQPVQGDNISNSKKEIEETLDTIDLAFQKLLDSLYEEEAMEVYSDISVLNALFAQEGLTKKDFDMK